MFKFDFLSGRINVTDNKNDKKGMEVRNFPKVKVHIAEKGFVIPINIFNFYLEK